MIPTTSRSILSMPLCGCHNALEHKRAVGEEDPCAVGRVGSLISPSRTDFLVLCQQRNLGVPALRKREARLQDHLFAYCPMFHFKFLAPRGAIQS